MVQNRLDKVFVILFLGLFWVQLSGLSCLNDFSQGESLSIDSSVHRSIADSINEVNGPGEDSCPCHLTFTPFVSILASTQGPIHPLAVVTPPVWRSLLSSFLFHPPKGQ